VLIHTSDAALASRLAALTAVTEAAVDEMRYVLLVSQVEVVATKEEVGRTKP
jgi:hypothetical protein